MQQFYLEIESREVLEACFLRDSLVKNHDLAVLDSGKLETMQQVILWWDTWKTPHIPRSVGLPLPLLGSPTKLGGFTPKLYYILRAFYSFSLFLQTIYEEHSLPLHSEVDIVALAKQPVDDFLQQGRG